MLTHRLAAEAISGTCSTELPESGDDVHRANPSDDFAALCLDLEREASEPLARMRNLTLVTSCGLTSTWRL